jgi:hypothetical protein
MRRRWMSSDRMTIQSLKRNIPVINLLQIIVAFLVFHCCSTQSQFSRPSYLNEQEVGKLVAVIADEVSNSPCMNSICHSLSNG